MRILVPLASFLAVVQLAASASDKRALHIKVPQNSATVMIDGSFSEGEWQSAAHLAVPNVADLYFQESADFVYIAVHYINSPSGILDLYLSPTEGQIFNLHASAKLGERQLRGTTFPDWLWWNNREWIANVSRVDSFDKRTFLPAPIREYQIRRSRFPSPIWRVHFELTAMTADNQTQSQSVFPPDTTNTSTAGWVVLALK